MSLTDPRGVDNDTELSLIGRRLRVLRKTHDLSQREVADAIGLPQSNLSRIENGKQRLNLTVLARMLGIYQTTIQEFFTSAAAAGPGTVEITARERQLLETWRRLPEEQRREVEEYADYKLFRARRDRASESTAD